MTRKIALSLLISLVFFAALLYFVPPAELLETLSSLEPRVLLLSFALYSLSQLSRALRWKLLIRDLSLRDLFLLNAVNILFNNVLPARTGELSWFYYARRLGVNLGSSVWSFLVGRLYDLLSLAALFLLSYLLVFYPPLTVPALFGVALLSLALPFLRLLLPTTGRIGELREFLEREFTPHLSLRLILLSGLSTALKALSLYVLVGGMLGVDPFLFTLGFAGGELTSVLPVHGFMGYGTYEAGFVLPLRLVGLEVGSAVKAGFLAHSFLLLSSAIWGAPATALLHTLSRRSP